MKRIVILISGRGSNMQAIVRACVQERWPAQVVAVISNRPGAAGLAYAQGEGIATFEIDHKRYDSRDAFDQALAQTIESQQADVIVLAGFMRILTPAFVQRFAGRMLNIHPSLLPSFTGLHTHQRAIDAGCKLAGSTVHFVTPVLDFGPIVAQGAVPVLADDSAESLAARVVALEHVLYPRAVRWLVCDRLQIDAGIVRQLDAEPQWLI